MEVEPTLVLNYWTTTVMLFQCTCAVTTKHSIPNYCPPPHLLPSVVSRLVLVVREKQDWAHKATAKPEGSRDGVLPEVNESQRVISRAAQ